MNDSRPIHRHPGSVPGEFYVENHCCTSCGVPQSLAPDLVGWVDKEMSHCVWKKQPETPEEVHRAIDVLNVQELGCHRYAGTDPAVLDRIDPDHCDHRLPRHARYEVYRQAAIERNVLANLSSREGMFKRLWKKLTGKRV